MNPIHYKTDKNGTQYFVDYTCPRCGGEGGRSEWEYTGYTCYECGGTGEARNPRKWKVYTPEYQAKLDEQREKRTAKKLGFPSVAAMHEAKSAEEARLEAERKAEEERIAAEKKAKEEREKALKARSNYVGEVGEKLKVTVTYEGSPYFERRSFTGYGTERCYIHRFRDDDGNLIVWKSCCGFPILGCNEGETVVVTGTVKEHSEYKDEKQTLILRAKVKRPA